MPRGSINNEINIFTGGGTGAAGSVGGSAGLVDSGEVNKSTEELRRNAA